MNKVIDAIVQLIQNEETVSNFTNFSFCLISRCMTQSLLDCPISFYTVMLEDIPMFCVSTGFLEISQGHRDDLFVKYANKIFTSKFG